MIVMENNGGVLSDIKVLDLSQGVAGPFCAKFLAGLGAEVIKVEPPFTGDSSRQSEPIMRGESGLERSALFAYLNTSKKSITCSRYIFNWYIFCWINFTLKQTSLISFSYNSFVNNIITL